MYNVTLEGFSVVVNVTRANGQEVREEILVETAQETSAILLALDATREAYPGHLSITWADVMAHPRRTRYVDGRGPVYGVWFTA